MSTAPILMPKLGLTMTEGLLAEWRVQAGHTVREGDVLFVVETDKIATEVEARADGRIQELRIAEGETVPVGSVVATWTGPAQGADAAERPSEPVPATGGAAHRRVLATPLARRMARELAIELASIAGSGPRGRIKAIDIQTANRQRRAARADVAPAAKATGIRRRATGFEQTVARRLSEAKRHIPHFYVMADADLTKLLALREALKGQTSTRISINHFIVLAVGRSLAVRPDINEIWDDGDIVSVGAPDVGIAIDTPRGLYAPVLRNAGALGVRALARAADEAAERARSGTLGADELSGGAITVSNVGMFGASWLVPIINPGQSAIVGVGKTRQEFRPDDTGLPSLRHVVSLVMAADHRVHDGVKAARFLGEVARLLENPLELLV